MKNFQLNDLWIVNPKTSINSEARAFALKGLDVLNSRRIAHTLGRALRDVDLVVGTSSVTTTSATNLPRVSITPSDLAKKINAAKGKVAIVFGRESSGLTNKEVDACDLMVTIPASRDYNVLNIATAASIIFYEIFNRRTTTRSLDLASKPAKYRLLIQFNRLLRQSENRQHRRKLVQRAFRNVISRSFITKRETSLLIGIFRKATSELM